MTANLTLQSEFVRWILAQSPLHKSGNGSMLLDFILMKWLLMTLSYL